MGFLGARPHGPGPNDPLGLRRNPSSGTGKSVPLLFANPASAERKKPWWIDDRHDSSGKSREELEREARERDHQRATDSASRERDGVSDSPSFLYSLFYAVPELRTFRLHRRAIDRRGCVTFVSELR